MEELLKKSKFVQKYKTLGYTDEQIEREWQKVLAEFGARSAQLMMNLAPINIRKKLECLLHQSTNNSINDFFQELKIYFQSNPNTAKVQKIMDQVADEVCKKNNIN